MEVLEKQQKRARKLQAQGVRKEAKSLSFQPLEGWIWFPGDAVLFPARQGNNNNNGAPATEPIIYANDETRMKLVVAELLQKRSFH